MSCLRAMFRRTTPLGLLMLLMLSQLSTPPMAAAPAPGWVYVSSAGPLQIVYVEPSRMSDPQLMAAVVAEVYRKIGGEHAFQIDFFDARDGAPVRPPYTLEQRRHHKAKFNFNPKNGLRRFVRLELVPDPDNAAKPRIRETEVELPLPWPPS